MRIALLCAVVLGALAGTAQDHCAEECDPHGASLDLAAVHRQREMFPRVACEYETSPTSARHLVSWSWRRNLLGDRILSLA